MYTKPHTRQHNQASEDDGKVKPNRGTTSGMIIRQAVVMAHLDLARATTSARSVMVAATHAMVVVAQSTIRGRSNVKNVKSLITTMKEMGNPFWETSGDVLVLDTSGGRGSSCRFHHQDEETRWSGYHRVHMKRRALGCCFMLRMVSSREDRRLS